jgi:2-polyprenyl-3-methyl-5-hydroxy-6-metoxy-1,4-benzoquinol methylase
MAMSEKSNDPAMPKDLVNTSDISPYYYGWFRSDVIAAVPSTAKTVLSVGCAGGITEAELVKRGVKVIGVEINPEVAKIARQRGLTVLEGDASIIDISQMGEPFDCLIYADILEHLPDPLSVLKRHVKSLKPGGVVYVSIPNFRHYSVLWQLFILGHVRYKDAGILDQTHLRMTTRKMVLEWFEETGIRAMNCEYVMHRRRHKIIAACLPVLGKEFAAVQIGLIGKKT